jgi:predicted methyltransferase
MNRTLTVLALFLLSPCAQGGSESLNLAIAESLAAADRLADDRKSDPLRRPDQVLEFFEVEPGMKVLDLFSGGGYYTELLSRVVGSDGEVTAHNNDAYLAYAKDVITARYADNRLPNVKRITAEATDLDLPANTLDAALVMLTWHDFYYVDPENGWPDIDESAMVEKLCNTLKPGAVLGLTDHVAATGSTPTESAQVIASGSRAKSVFCEIPRTISASPCTHRESAAAPTGLFTSSARKNKN